MKKNLLALILFLFTLSSFAQDGQYSMGYLGTVPGTLTACNVRLTNTYNSSGVYWYSEDDQVVIKSSTGTLLNVNLTFHYTEATYDYVRVYDGPSTASPLIANWSGTTLPFNGLNCTSTGSVITIVYHTDATVEASFVSGGYRYSGFDLIVGCTVQPCGSNAPAGDNCATAAQICNLNGYCGNTSGWYNADNESLGGTASPGFQGSIENNSWVNFVAAATTATISVNVNNCLVSTSGIQGIVYKSTNCTSFTPVSGSYFSQYSGGSAMTYPIVQTISLSGLVAGSDYYLMLDGYNGNICDYTVTAIGGVEVLALTASNNTICPNQSITVTAPSGATGYTFNPTPTSVASNVATYSNLTANTTISCTVGGYCGATSVVTLPITVKSTPTITAVSSQTACAGSPVNGVAFTTSPAGGTFSWTNNNTSIGLAASGTGSITGYAAPPVASSTTGIITVTPTLNGCVGNSTTFSITVNPKPTPSILTSTNSICLGSSVTFTAGTASTYTWSTGGSGNLSGTSGSVVSATPTAAGNITYTVNMTAANTCTNTTVTTVTVNSIPAAVAGTAAVLNCTLTSQSLSGSGGVTYSWTGPAGGITSGSNTATPVIVKPGTYSLVVTNAAGCTSTVSTVAVTQNTVAPSLTVSPSQTLTCGGSALTLTGTASPSTCTPVWTGGVSSGANSYTATASASNAYTLTVTNPANGCTNYSVTNVAPSPGLPGLSSPVISNSLTCTQNTASIIVTTTTSPVSYTWTGPGITSGTTSNSITVNAAGNYTLLVRNTSFTTCVSSIVANVPLNNTVPTVTATNSGTLTCSTLTVPLTASSNVSTLTYTWSGPSVTSGVNSVNAVAGAQGTYTVAITNTVNGCTNSTVTTVAQNIIPPSISASNSGSITCTNTVVTLTGGPVSGVTYTWTGPAVSGSANTQTTTATATGNYTLQIKDNINGCTSTSVTNVPTNVTPPAITATSGGTLTCSTSTVLLTSTPSAGMTYTWTGSGITSGVNSSTAIVNASGNYSVAITNTVNGCVSNSVVAVALNNTLAVVSSTVSNILSCTNTVAVVSASTVSSPVTYTWSGTGITSSANTNTISVNQPGTFNYTVTNSNGCKTTGSQIVDQNIAAPTVFESTPGLLTCSALTTTISLTTSDSPVSYSWTGSGIVSGSTSSLVTVNAPGVYSYTVTNTSNGCKTFNTLNVSQDITAPAVSPNTPAVLSCTVLNTDVSLTTTVTPVTYIWTGSGITGATTNSLINVSQPGNFNYTVTNTSNGCKTTGLVAVTQNTTAPSLTICPSQTLSCGASVLTLTGTANPSTCTPVWTGGVSGGANSYTATASASNDYTLTVTNPSNGCSNYSVTNVSPSPGVPDLNSPIVSNSLTCTQNTASIIVTTTTTPVSYTWTGPGITSGTTSNSITVNAAGNYTLLVRNTTFTTCVSSIIANVPLNNTVPSVTATNTGTLTCSTLTVPLTASSNVSTLTYTWTGPSVTSGANSANAVAGAQGTYTVAITNTVNGCTNTTVTTVAQNTAAITPTISIPSVLNCTNTSQSMQALPSSGVTYTWTGTGITSGTNSDAVVVNQPNTYTLNVTNLANGCPGMNTVTVTQNINTPTVTVAPTASINCSNTITPITLSTTATPVSYAWSGPGIVSGNGTNTVMVNQGGTYNYTVTNTSNACFATGSQSVILDNTLPSVAPAVSNSINCTMTTASVSATTTASPVTYSWSGTGITSATNISTITVNQGGLFNYTVTNTFNNCKSTGTQSVTLNNTPPSVAAAVSNSINCTVTTASVSATTTSSPVTYNWSGTGITSATNISTITVNQGGLFSYTVTNTFNNCTATGTQSVTLSNTPPSVASAVSNSINCTATTASVSATTTSSPVSYNWSGAGITSATNISTITVNQGGLFNYTVTNTANNCTATGTKSVTLDNTPPSVAAAVSNSINCTVTTASVSATTTTSPVSYNWSGTGITSATNISTITVNAGGNYNYTVTNTFNNCTATGTRSVTLDNTPPTSIASTTGSITCVTNTINLNSSLAGMNYTWTASSGSSILSGSSLQNAVGQGLGTYTLNIFNAANTCTFQTTIAAIHNTTTPTSVNAGPDKSLVCVTPTLSLDGSATPPSAIANWLGGVSSPSSFTTSTGAAGVYTLQAIEPTTGCFIWDTVRIYQSINSPTVTPNAITNSITCTNSVVAIGINVLCNNTYSVSWSGSGLSGPTTNTLSTTATLTGVYQATVTDEFNGCISISSFSVPIDQTPVVVSVSPASSVTCSNPTQTLNVSPVGANYTYTWTGSGITSGANSSNPVVNSGGNYSVVVTNTINGCTGNNVLNVPIDIATPTVNIATNSFTSTCATPIVTITGVSTNPSSGLTYSWTSPSGALINDPTIVNPQVLSGTGIFTLVVTNTVNGCSNAVGQSTVDVQQDANIPVVTLSTNTLELNCATTVVTTTASTTSTPVTYSWSPTAGIISGTETTATPQFTAIGSYSLVVTNTTSGCKTVDNANVVSVTQNTIAPTMTLTSAGSNTGTLTCLNTSVVITPTVNPSTTTYTVISSAGSSVSTGSVVFTSPDTYTISVMDNATGCVSTNTDVANIFTVSQNITPPTMTLTSAGANTGTLTCLNTSVVITPTVNPANTTYTVMSSAGSSVSTGSVVFTSPDTYTISVMDNTTGCVSTNTDVANIFTVSQNITPPTMTLTSTGANTGTLTCLNTSVVITPTVNPSTTTYTVISSTGSAVNTGSLVFTSPDTYTISVMDNTTGCVSTNTDVANTFTVSQETTAPTFSFTSSNAYSDTLTCKNPSVTITPTVVLGTSGTVNYSWTDGVTTYTTNSVTTTVPASYTLTVMNSVTGCTNTVTGNDNVFTVVPNTIVPTFSFTSSNAYSDTLTCKNPSVTITPTVVLGTSGTVNYSWTDGVTTYTTNSVTTTVPASYTLTVMNSVTGCTNTVTGNDNVFTVVPNTVPPTGTVTVVSTNSTIGCAGNSSTVTLGAIVSSNATFTWMPVNIAGPSDLPVTNAGVYDIQITDAINGCTNTAVAQVTVTGNVIPPGVSVIPSVVVPCGVTTTSLSGVSSSTNSVTYTWSGPGTIDQTNPTAPVVDQPGDYTVTVTDLSNGCTSTETVNVSLTNVTATISANPTEGIAPLPVSFTCTSTGATSWTWDFGDGNGSTSQNTSNTFVTGGTYTVMLTAYSGTCSTTQTITVVVEDGLTLEIPNVFTPNNDGINDVFTIKSTGVKEISLQIFNRWGEKLYEFVGAKAAWDGKVPNGETATDGTYFYFVKAKGFDGKEIEKHGSMNLFR